MNSAEHIHIVVIKLCSPNCCRHLNLMWNIFDLHVWSSSALREPQQLGLHVIEVILVVFSHLCGGSKMVIMSSVRR